MAPYVQMNFEIKAGTYPCISKHNFGSESEYSSCHKQN